MNKTLKKMQPASMASRLSSLNSREPTKEGEPVGNMARREPGCFLKYMLGLQVRATNTEDLF